MIGSGTPGTLRPRDESPKKGQQRVCDHVEEGSLTRSGGFLKGPALQGSREGTSADSICCVF